MVPRLLIGLALLSTGCLKKLPAFACADDAQCGAGGACEPNGLCSFADGTCASGRRFGADQGELSSTCVGDNLTSDGGVDAPTDAMVDCPDDDDCDAVANASDNCRNVANPDQAAEDSDGTGDACDICPPFDDAGEDADQDGVGDACDPNPGMPDTMDEFVGFRSMPANWQATGAVSLDGNGSAIADSDQVASMLTRAAPNSADYTIWTEATLDDIDPGLLGALGLTAQRIPGTDNHAGLCQLVGPNAGMPELRLFDTSSGSNLLDATPHTFNVGTRYELFFQKDNTSFVCDASNPQAGTGGTITAAPNNAEVGLRVRNATATYHWIMVIRSP